MILPLLTLLLPLTFALPSPSTSNLQKRFSESNPWTLSSVTITESSTSNSSISFHFCDTNASIELETQCSRSVAAGSTIDDGQFASCDNATVGFSYSSDKTGEGNIAVQRNHIDPAVGPCPQYCVVTAFGNANTTLTESDSTDGTVTLTQDVLEVPITALVA